MASFASLTGHPHPPEQGSDESHVADCTSRSPSGAVVAETTTAYLGSAAREVPVPTTIETTKPIDPSARSQITSTTLSDGAPAAFNSTESRITKPSRLTLPPLKDIFPSPAIPELHHLPPDPHRNPLGPVAEYYLPLKECTGDIVRMPYTMQKPENEAVHSATRKTVSGKTITYTLSVKQQPERARACGAGARACADRRPVDPPPVVELRIFEGEATKTDVTLSYNANFFLFATLELARPIANGRMHMPHIIPVLTGCPVAGANYLDRPAAAAYFLFPDLSVRHEGWYRLSFNLYEATKDKDDVDTDLPITTCSSETQPADPSKMFDCMAWRLEVKSTPFQVYSAKKFPGLSESTEISRIVADQGCRVRIRRDIRMRKRVNGKEEYEGYDEGLPSADRYATPDSSYPPPTPTDGMRSASRCSIDTTQLSTDPFRRFSQPEPGFGASPHNGRIPLPGPMSIQSTLPLPNASRPSSSHSLKMSLPIGHSADRLYPDHTLSRPQLPLPTALPQTIVAETSPRSRESIQLPALLIDSSQPPTHYDAARRQWALPELTNSAKRSHSPRSDPTQDSLKQGMRPETARPAGGQAAGSIEADTDPYSSYDNEAYVNIGQFMEYRRACGRASRKAMPKLGL